MNTTKTVMNHGFGGVQHDCLDVHHGLVVFIMVLLMSITVLLVFITVLLMSNTVLFVFITVLVVFITFCWCSSRFCL
jgi:Zn-dependent membrane protease YugP